MRHSTLLTAPLLTANFTNPHMCKKKNANQSEHNKSLILGYFLGYKIHRVINIKAQHAEGKQRVAICVVYCFHDTRCNGVLTFSHASYVP